MLILPCLLELVVLELFIKLRKMEMGDRALHMVMRRERGRGRGRGDRGPPRGLGPRGGSVDSHASSSRGSRHIPSTAVPIQEAPSRPVAERSNSYDPLEEYTPSPEDIEEPLEALKTRTQKWKRRMLRCKRISSDCKGHTLWM